MLTQDDRVSATQLMKKLLLPLFLAACSQPMAPRLDEIARGEIKIVDLGYSLNEKNPHWPGEAYKPFHFETIATVEEHGVFSGAFSMPEHLGTHIDAAQPL